jgi:hypothetical protein
MSTKVGIRYLAAAALACVMLLPAAGSRAQDGPESMFQDLIGEWNNTSTGETGGYSIFVRRNGDVWQQGAPMARVADTIRAGGNFAFEGRYPPPDRRRFRCTYYVTFLAGGAKASFRLVDQRGEGITCAQGTFERVVRR